jgi:tetratricopeptide (TPR) repeat protein
MKISRHFQRVLILSVLAALTMFSSGCDYINMVLSKDKVNQGAILYNRGSFKEAQVFFREATDLNPKSTVAWLFLGATLVKDYKAEEGDKQVQIANEALKVYKTALELSENSCGNYNNAISYIATIYDDLGNTDEWRNWMLKRAEGKCATNKAEIATTLYSVAVKY